MIETPETPPAGAASEAKSACGGAGPLLSQLARLFEPPGEAGKHFRQARIELLKGVREIIDYRIEALNKTERKGSKITVE